jgi:sugar-phosphate isomerases, RpiB/LacA/LacB family
LKNIGAHTYEETDDYPDFIIPAAEKVAEKPEEYRGIVLGGSGQGEAIAANKVPGIRAALYYGQDLEIVELSRTHNNTNVLSLGARKLDIEQAREAIDLWLRTGFQGVERHKRRNDKVDAYRPGA